MLSYIRYAHPLIAIRRKTSRLSFLLEHPRKLRITARRASIRNARESRTKTLILGFEEGQVDTCRANRWHSHNTHFVCVINALMYSYTASVNGELIRNPTTRRISAILVNEIRANFFLWKAGVRNIQIHYDVCSLWLLASWNSKFVEIRQCREWELPRVFVLFLLSQTSNHCNKYNIM